MASNGNQIDSHQDARRIRVRTLLPVRLAPLRPADGAGVTMVDRRNTRAITGGVALAMAVAITAQIILFWPGIMVWDAIRQYGQAITGRYDDWHPPAMNWLWRQFLGLHAGPAPMLVLQASLYWCGFGLLILAALLNGRRYLAIALMACALLPIPLFLVGTILKDSLMVGALVLTSGLIALRAPDDRPMRVCGIALLLGAATLRFNAAPACLPLLIALLPAGWRKGRTRLILSTLCGLALLAMAMPLANRLLRADRSGVELSLVIYDLGGITKMSGISVLPAVGVPDPVAVNARCYSPISWDRYAWWGPFRCAIGFTNIHAALTKSGESPYRLWASAIAAHPVAYAAHRLAHFNNNVRFMVHDGVEPSLSLRSDANAWGYQLGHSASRDHLGAMAIESLSTPLGWPAFWLALGLAILIVLPAIPDAGPTGPITLSALLYGFSYVPLSVASEVRYHLWTMTGVAIAATFMASSLAHGSPIPRWRLACAATLPALVIILGFAARLSA